MTTKLMMGLAGIRCIYEEPMTVFGVRGVRAIAKYRAELVLALGKGGRVGGRDGG